MSNTESQSFRTQLVEWMKEIVPFSNFEKYARKTRESFVEDTHGTNHRDNHVNYIICTAEHRYSISAHPEYLGCIASTTRERPGETWNRGNDLPDGKFCRETWDAIKDAILRYELVKLTPVPSNKRDQLSLGSLTAWGIVSGIELIQGVRFYHFVDPEDFSVKKPSQAADTVETIPNPPSCDSPYKMTDEEAEETAAWHSLFEAQQRYKRAQRIAKGQHKANEEWAATRAKDEPTIA
jgi:hypothetical protein